MLGASGMNVNAFDAYACIHRGVNRYGFICSSVVICIICSW